MPRKRTYPGVGENDVAKEIQNATLEEEDEFRAKIDTETEKRHDEGVLDRWSEM